MLKWQFPEQVWQHLSPFQWAHMHLNGSYHFTSLTLEGDFRPLRKYLGPHAYLSATSQEEEDAPMPIQLSLLGEDEENR